MGISEDDLSDGAQTDGAHVRRRSSKEQLRKAVDALEASIKDDREKNRSSLRSMKKSIKEMQDSIAEMQKLILKQFESMEGSLKKLSDSEALSDITPSSALELVQPVLANDTRKDDESVVQTEPPSSEKSDDLQKTTKPKKDIFRGQLPKVSSSGAVECEEIIQLVEAVEYYRQGYTDGALKVAIKNSVKATVISRLDPGGKLTLDELLEKFKNIYNSPQRLMEDKNRVENFRFKRGGDRVEQVQQYMDLVGLMNSRGKQMGALGYVWPNREMMDHLLNHILEKTSHFRNELKRRWDLIPPVQKDDISYIQIRDMAAGADQHARDLEMNETPRIQIFSNGKPAAAGRIFRCWRCGNQMKLKGNRHVCECTDRPVCQVENCNGNHLTEFHNEATRRVFSNGKTSKKAPTPNRAD